MDVRISLNLDRIRLKSRLSTLRVVREHVTLLLVSRQPKPALPRSVRISGRLAVSMDGMLSRELLATMNYAGKPIILSDTRFAVT